MTDVWAQEKESQVWWRVHCCYLYYARVWYIFVVRWTWIAQVYAMLCMRLKCLFCIQIFSCLCFTSVQPRNVMNSLKEHVSSSHHLMLILQFQKQKLQLQWGSYCLFCGVQRGKEMKIKCLLYAATWQTWCYLILIRKEFFENYSVAWLPAGAVVKNTSANAGDTRDSDSIPGLRRSLE